MANRTKGKGKGTAHFWPLAAFVIAATVGIMLWVGGEETTAAETSDAAQQSADQDVLEVQPLIPRGKIASASWRSDGSAPARDARDEQESSTSLLDRADELDPFGEDTAKARRAAQSLKETVDRIHGLGVYVAPAESDKGGDKDSDKGGDK